MFTEETLNAMGTPFEIQPEVLAACSRFCPDTWSDLYKDAHGFRPRYGLGDKTAEQLDALWDRTVSDLEHTMAEEDRQEALALAAWNKLVEETIGYGAGDYATAVRWIMDDERDIEYVLWEHGITSYKNTREIRELANI